MHIHMGEYTLDVDTISSCNVYEYSVVVKLKPVAVFAEKFALCMLWRADAGGGVGACTKSRISTNSSLAMSGGRGYFPPDRLVRLSVPFCRFCGQMRGNEKRSIKLSGNGGLTGKGVLLAFSVPQKGPYQDE